MRRNWRVLLLLGLLASAAILAPARAQEAEAVDEEVEEAEEEDERAKLLVRRIVSDKRPLEAKDATVTIELYNAGNIPATDVQVTELAWPEGYTVAGELTASFDSIPVGTSVRHSYVITPAAAGVYTHGPVTVSYIAEAEADAERQTTTSSPLHLRVYSFGDSVQEQALEWGASLTNGMLTTTTDWLRVTYVSAAAVSALLFFKAYRSHTEKSTARKRQQAYDELMAGKTK